MKRKALAILLCALTAAVAALRAQTPAGGPSFEVASVKASNPNAGGMMAMVPQMPAAVNGRLTATNVPLRLLIRAAYVLQDFQIAGGPSWQMSKRFDIQAKAEDGFKGGTKEMMPLLKNLLAERFALKAHLEQRDMPIANLVVARGDGKLGAALVKSATTDCPDPQAQAEKMTERITKEGPMALMTMMRENAPCMMVPMMPAGAASGVGLRANAQPISQLVLLLTQTTGKMVKDQTGLTGLYDWTLTFDPQALLAVMSRQLGVTLPAGAALPPSDSPAILTAIQEQLGLKLVSDHGPVDVLVIDSAELPTDN